MTERRQAWFDDGDRVVLSSAGAARRDALRDALVRAVVARRRRRRAARGALAAGAVLVLAWAAWPATRAVPDARPAPEPPRLTHAVLEVVRDDAAVAAARIVRDRPIPPERLLDDAGLVRELAAANHACGILRSGARVALLEPLATED